MMPAAEAERNASISVAPEMLTSAAGYSSAETCVDRFRRNRTARNAPRGHELVLADQFASVLPP
jgi:hypothetical protein